MQLYRTDPKQTAQSCCNFFMIVKSILIKLLLDNVRSHVKNTLCVINQVRKRCSFTTSVQLRLNIKVKHRRQLVGPKITRSNSTENRYDSDYKISADRKTEE